MNTKRHYWDGDRLMLGDRELARIEPHKHMWRVRYGGAVSRPTIRSFCVELAEMLTRI